jgi:hypothetical protein
MRAFACGRSTVGVSETVGVGVIVGVEVNVGVLEEVGLAVRVGVGLGVRVSLGTGDGVRVKEGEATAPSGSALPDRGKLHATTPNITTKISQAILQTARSVLPFNARLLNISIEAYNSS